MWGDMGHGGLGGLLMVFWWLLPIGLVALVVWGLARGRGDRATGVPDDAMRILEARFARGEIESGEFEQRRRELRG